MDEHLSHKLNGLFLLYSEIKKTLAFHPLRRKKIGYENLYNEANGIFVEVHTLRAKINPTDINKDLDLYIRYFDYASASLTAYLSNRVLFEKGLINRQVLNQKWGEHNLFNKKLIIALKKFE